MSKPLQLLEYVGFLLAAYPLLVLTALLAFVVRARIHFGHWPLPSDREIWRPEWRTHYDILICGGLLIPIVAFIALMIALGGRLQTRQFRCWKITALTVLSLAALTLYVWTDPGGFVKWFWR